METLKLQPHPQPNEQEADDDRSLVRRMAGGDGAALRVFYDRHGSGIYALCLRVLGNAHDAEDVLVDVFHEYWRRISGYDAARGSPIGLLVTLARSRAIDRRRSLARMRATTTLQDPATAAAASVLAEDPARRPEQQASISQQREIVRSALRSLQPEYRQAIERAYYDGMSHSEIAASLGKPLGTVKTYIRQGLLRLRDSLRDLSPSPAPAPSSGGKTFSG